MTDTDKDLEIIARHLRMARASKGWSQAEVAKLVDISQSSLSLYEQEEREPRVNALSKLAQAYGVTLDWLCGISEVGGPL